MYIIRIKKYYLEEFVLIDIEKHVLNYKAIPYLSKELNERLKAKYNDNHEMLINLRNKLDELSIESNDVDSVDITEDKLEVCLVSLKSLYLLGTYQNVKSL